MNYKMLLMVLGILGLVMGFALTASSYGLYNSYVFYGYEELNGEIVEPLPYNQFEAYPGFNLTYSQRAIFSFEEEGPAQVRDTIRQRTPMNLGNQQQQQQQSYSVLHE